MIVNDIGPLDAKIMIIGGAPDSVDEKQGVPFVGASGKLLQSLCRHAQINWKECYVTNVVDKRPRQNDFGIYYNDKARRVPKPELELCWRRLRDKIKRIAPRVVIAVGAEALRAVTGKRGIKDWRGCPLYLDGIPIIPTYHPAAVLREYSLHPVAELDLQKALRWSVSLPVLPHPIKHILEPSLQTVLDWLAACKDQVTAFDLESVGRTVRCIAIACDTGAICIPFIRFKSYAPSPKFGSSIISVGIAGPSTSSYWSVADEQLIIKALAHYFADPSIKKVGQNSIGFDQPFLENEFGFTFENHSFDCMHAFHLLYPELPKGLSFLCSILTDYPNYWTGKLTEDDIQEWTYNCWDAVITLDVYKKIAADLVDSKLWHFYKSTLHPLAEALAKAQERGVLVDKDFQKKLLTRFEKKKVDHECRVRKLGDEPTLNINSHTQLKNLIYEKLLYRPVTNRFGKVSTDEECMKKLMKKHPDEQVFAEILAYRKASKMLDFLNSQTNPNGRMSTSFNASGTTTGRISSSKTIWGTGMNLMNVPKDLRDIFIAPPGKLFVKQDLSQAETRVVAHILKRVGDPTLWEKYKDPAFDIHRWMASAIYRKPEKQITNEERNVGKLANHSGNYRAGPGVLETTATKLGIPGISYDVAREILVARGRAIPGLAIWWDWIEKELARTRTLWTCLGRRRIFFGRLEHSTFRDATAFEPQSVVGDLNNIIFTQLDKHLDDDCYPLLQVHDEVVVECPEDKVNHVIETMQTVGRIALEIADGDPLFIPLDISVGPDWKNCKDI